MEEVRCIKCSRPLRDPDSIARGMGPECAGVYGGHRTRCPSGVHSAGSSSYAAIGHSTAGIPTLFTLVDKMPNLVVQKGARQRDMMSAKFPTLEDRKRLLQSFHDLPPKDKEMLYKAVEHLRWLTILWDLESLSVDSMPSTPEKRHILLAYKLLQILWFSKLPERDHQTFTVYVRDRLPDDQDPEVVNDIFETNSDELAARCKSLERPKWLTNEAKATKISLESFPQKVS